MGDNHKRRSALRGEIYGKPLSPREREVLELRAQGLTLKAVGRKLNLAKGTICTIQNSAFQKLGARWIQQAIRLLTTGELGPGPGEDSKLDRI